MSGELHTPTTPPMLPIASTCAWCPDARERTAALMAQGYQVSHGICETHAAELEAEMESHG